MPIPALLPTGAIGGLIRVSNYYDRNPLNQSLSNQQTSIAPHGLTTRFTYTVPTNRKAIVEGGQVALYRQTVATTLGLIFNHLGLAAIPFDNFLYNNALGDYHESAVPSGNILFAGSIVICQDEDLSTGGTLTYQTTCFLVEFDA